MYAKINKISFFILIGIIIFFLHAAGVFAAEVEPPIAGADAVPDLFAAFLAADGFSTAQGGSPASALNPAQAGESQRMIFDLSYLAIPAFPDLGKEQNGYMQAISLGALFPTRYGVFGGSLRYIGGFGDKQFDYFPIKPTFSGNLFAAKEIYPRMSLGLGFNFGFGAGTTISGDLGFRYNLGNLAFMENFTIAVVLGELGVSYFPSWLTPAIGVSFDLIHIHGGEGKASPFILNFAADLKIPSLFYPEYINLIFKAGTKFTIAEVVTLSVSWPGGSGLNIRELSEKNVSFPSFPAIGLTFNIALPSEKERTAGGHLPSDGDLKVSAAFKPLYEGITAIGGGVSWYAGRADTKPPVIILDYSEPLFFSPNNDGRSDVLSIPVSITDQNYIVSWKAEIKNENGDVVRIIENKEQRFEKFDAKEFLERIFSIKKQIEIPSVIEWDGYLNNGDLARDGRYFFKITAVDNSGNTSVTESFEAVLKNTPPSVRIANIPETQRIFDPKGSGASGGRHSITFVPSGQGADLWESGIYNSQGVKIRSFETRGNAPSAVVWDGRDDSNKIAPDGVYSFQIRAEDKAQNSAGAQMTNIIVDSREAGAFLTSSVLAIRPSVNQSANLVDFSVRLLLNDGIESWKLELRDTSGALQRSFSGGANVPAVQGWNGLNEQGVIREGIYLSELTVNYSRGDIVKAIGPNILVDVSGPELSMTTTPEYFSPDNDGENDELIINLSAKDASPVADWSIEIRPVESLNTLFKKIEGQGTPANRITWNGRSDRGELVQSASAYQYTFRAADALGNSSTITGRFVTDVLVMREGDRLRILVPSIQFRPNYADFVDLPRDVISENNRIIRRIAQILNQFRDYRVQVEGHANPTQPEGETRDREEPILKNISETRARAIVDLLVRNGVTRSRLTATGAGGTTPVAAFDDRDNWWKNRRVEFYLIK